MLDDCEMSGQHSMFAGETGSKFTIECPRGCSAPPVNVYGSDIYSDDSSVCQAAIHYGVIGDQGGEVTIQIENGKQKYLGSSQNGVESLSKQSFIRSFSLIGEKGNSCEFFQEKYNPTDIFQHWQVIDV